MVYEEIVGKMKAAYEAADAGGITEHAAIQFNISGEGEGAFYIEVAGGKVYVQPYEYYDRDAIVTTNASTLLEIAEGKLNIGDAVSANRLWIDGNVAKVFVLNQIPVGTDRQDCVADESGEPEIESYREGILMSNRLQNWNCCVPRTGDEEHFRYIEVIYKDGTHKFIYSDDAGYERFLESFHRNRFTSFHEFFTTEELAVEHRGALALKYYVRREESDYVKMPLEEARKKLAGCTRLADRVTVLGEFDRGVNYHYEAFCPTEE